MTIPQPAISYLASLGFPMHHLINTDGDPTYHPDHPGIFVAPRARSYNTDYFRLAFDATVRSGLDRIYIGAPSVFPCLVDIKRPRWKQTVSPGSRRPSSRPSPRAPRRRSGSRLRRDAALRSPRSSAPTSRTRCR